jgi:hypothetical protein
VEEEYAASIERFTREAPLAHTGLASQQEQFAVARACGQESSVQFGEFTCAPEKR